MSHHGFNQKALRNTCKTILKEQKYENVSQNDKNAVKKPLLRFFALCILGLYSWVYVGPGMKRETDFLMMQLT